MLKIKTKTNGGFIALISVLILSVVLLGAVISLAQYSLTTRYALLDLEQKTKSEALASACLEIAKIAVMNDELYETTNHTIPVGKAECTIRNIFTDTPTVGKSRIETFAVSSKAVTNLRVEIEVETSKITRQEEIPNF